MLKKFFVVGVILLVTFSIINIFLSRRLPKTVVIRSEYVSKLLLTDRPVPIDPNDSRNIDFEYVGPVDTGTKCIVLTKAEGYGDVYYELACEGKNRVGWLPADAVSIIDYWDTPVRYQWTENE